MSSWNLEKDVLWLEVTMSNLLLMHILEAVKDLPNIMLDVVHRNGLLCLFSLPQRVLQTAVAEFHHSVLDDSLLLVNSVEELDKLNDVGSVFEEGEDFILTRDDIACLLCAFEGYFLIAVHIESFEDIA